jgi:hypothetical protein
MYRQLQLATKPNARACARLRPSSVRALISSLSNSGSPPSTVRINRPCGAVVSVQASASDRKPAAAGATASNTLSRSRVERARRSKRGDCLGQRLSVGHCSADLLRKHPRSSAALSADCCASSVWPSVLTRAYTCRLSPQTTS